MDKRNIYHCYRLYKDADDKCKNLIAQIKPFLTDFATKHNVEAKLFNDVIILYGPGMAEYDYLTANHPDLYEEWRKGTVNVYNLKWSGTMFVIKLKLTNVSEDKSTYISTEAFMVYGHTKYDVPTNIAVAINNLYDAQQTREMIYVAYRNEIMSAQNKCK